MVMSIIPSDRYVPSPWRAVRDFYVLTVLFCALIAAVLALSAPSLQGFLRWLLIAESIGLCGATAGTLIGRLPRLRRYRPTRAHMFISSFAIPIGYVAGSSLAYRLLGEPIPVLQSDPRRAIALLATALATMFIVYLDAMRHRIENEASARVEAERRAGQSQLRLLRTQLEPHMLFNTLANLRSLIDVDPRRAKSMIDQVIVYLRSALGASQDEATTLRQEFVQLRAYLEIMALRMGARMRYELLLPEALATLTVPPMLLQPLVENAIKHGIEPKIGHSEIIVQAARGEDGIELTVTDSGLGLGSRAETASAVPSIPTVSAGYGLTHVRERLSAFYGPHATLTLTPNSPEGVRATVRIPS